MCSGESLGRRGHGAPLAPPLEGGPSVAGEPGKFVKKETKGSLLTGHRAAVVGPALQLCRHILVTGRELSPGVRSNSVCEIQLRLHTCAPMLERRSAPHTAGATPSVTMRGPEALSTGEGMTQEAVSSSGRGRAFLQKDAKSTNTSRKYR